MAKGFKTGGRDFLPGHKDTPNAGRPKMPEEIKRIRAAVLTDIAQCMEALTMDETAALEFLKGPDKSLFKNILANAYVKKDWKTIEAFLDRFIGKPKQQVDIKQETKQITQDIPPEKLERMIAILEEDDS